MDAPTLALAAMIAALLDGQLGPGEFADSYQRQYSAHPPDTRVFDILDPLWMICEDYYSNPSFWEPGDTTDEELIAGARQALRELAELGRRGSRWKRR